MSEHSVSPSEHRLRAANHDWRHQIASHVLGLRPLLDPSRDHIRGSEHPTVTLVEYGDYQSSSCLRAAADLVELRMRFDGELRFAFRHFPIGDAHPLALHAASVAEAAGAQGRFWEMHDLIYGRNHDLTPPLLRKFAERIGLDLDRFDSDLAGDAHLQHIMEDFQSGVDSGVNGTPTFFIDDQRLDGNLEIEALEPALKRAAMSAAPTAGGCCTAPSITANDVGSRSGGSSWSPRGTTRRQTTTARAWASRSSVS